MYFTQWFMCTCVSKKKNRVYYSHLFVRNVSWKNIASLEWFCLKIFPLNSTTDNMVISLDSRMKINLIIFSILVDNSLVRNVERNEEISEIWIWVVYSNKTDSFTKHFSPTNEIFLLWNFLSTLSANKVGFPFQKDVCTWITVWSTVDNKIRHLFKALSII